MSTTPAPMPNLGTGVPMGQLMSGLLLMHQRAQSMAPKHVTVPMHPLLHSLLNMHFQLNNGRPQPNDGGPALPPLLPGNPRPVPPTTHGTPISGAAPGKPTGAGVRGGMNAPTIWGQA